MAKGRLDRKEMKEDLFLKESEQLAEFVRAHKEKVMIVCLSIVVVLVAFWSLTHHQKKRIEQASALLILAKANQDSMDKKAQLKTLVEDYLGLPEGVEGLFLLLQEHYDKGEYQECLDLCKKALGKYKQDSSLSLKIQLFQAVAYEQLGEYDFAIKTLKESTALFPEHYLLPEAYLTLGRCLLLKGQKNEAKDVFKQVSEEYSTSLWASKAEEYLKTLS